MTKSTNTKVLVVGNLGTGKTALSKRLTDITFSSQYKRTLAYDIFNVSEPKIELFDVTGDHNCSTVMTHFALIARNTHVVLAFFALSDMQSLSDIQSYWLPKVRAVSPDAKIILVGNKQDLVEHRCIPQNKIDDFMKHNNLTVGINLSAKTDPDFSALMTLMDVNSASKQVEPLGPLLTDDDVKPYPKSYQKIWDKIEGSSADKARALLDDYSKGSKWYSTLSVLAHGHFARHHKNQVRIITRQLADSDITLEVALKQLKSAASTSNGSLAKRIEFIEQHTQESLNPL